MAAAGKDWRRSMLRRGFCGAACASGDGWNSKDQASCAVNTADFGAAARAPRPWQIRPVTSIKLSDPDAPGPARRKRSA